MRRFDGIRKDPVPRVNSPLATSLVRQRWLRLLVVAGALCGACERSTKPTTQSGRSPRATIEQLIAARGSGSYQSMSEFIVPKSDHEVVTTLMAVDEFLHANKALCDHVRQEITVGLSQAINQSYWSAHLGVFSPYVELVDQHDDGETATVSFTIDGRVPVQHAELVLWEGAWRYDPGGGYDPKLPAAFRRMARGLRDVLEDLKGGRLDVAAIRAEPDRLAEEIRIRLLPGVKMLPAPPDQQP